MVKACLRGWGASKQSYSCLGSWVNRLGKFTGPDSILMQTQSTRPKAHWVGRYKWLDNHLQPSADTNLVYSCLLVIHEAERRRLSSLWTSHFLLREWNVHDAAAFTRKLWWTVSIRFSPVSWKMSPELQIWVWSGVMNGMSPQVLLYLCIITALKCGLCSLQHSLEINFSALVSNATSGDSHHNRQHLSLSADK